jgi:hypothetical protein
MLTTSQILAVVTQHQMQRPGYARDLPTRDQDRDRDVGNSSETRPRPPGDRGGADIFQEGLETFTNSLRLLDGFFTLCCSHCQVEKYEKNENKTIADIDSIVIVPLYHRHSLWSILDSTVQATIDRHCNLEKLISKDFLSTV